MNIKQDLIPLGKIRPGKIITPLYVTIHSTANLTSNALGERSWLTNPSNTRIASWHVCVDDKQAVMAIPLNEESYHAGTSLGNMTSIGVEICESGDREQTLKNASVVVADLLKQLKLTPDKLKQHFDWNGKDCPRILRDTGRWQEFVNMVKANFNPYEYALKVLCDKYKLNFEYWKARKNIDPYFDDLIIKIAKG